MSWIGFDDERLNEGFECDVNNVLSMIWTRIWIRFFMKELQDEYGFE